MSAKTMKRAKASTALARRRKAADVLPEYDFSRARRNKYASRYAKGAMVVTLDPDVAVVFRGASAVKCGPEDPGSCQEEEPRGSHAATPEARLAIEHERRGSPGRAVHRLNFGSSARGCSAMTVSPE